MMFNETDIITSINIRSLLKKATTLITSTETTKIIENAPNISNTDIADTNDTNTILKNIENTLFENITIEPASIRRSTRHKKATFKAIGANVITANTVGIAEAPATPANERKSEEENYLPKAIIAKTTIANENKPTYEEAIANSKKSQWR
jgi:hypothetical protein